MRQRSRRGVLGLVVAALVLVVPASASAYVYWIDVSLSTVGRANLDGTAPVASFIGPFNAITDVVGDGQHLFVSRSITGLIARTDLDGGNPNPSFVSGAGATGMAINATHVFYADSSTSAVGRVGLDGAGRTNIVTGLTGIQDVAIEGTHVYWVRSGGTVGVANLDGSSPSLSLMSGLSSPTGLAVDAGHIYWTSTGTNSVGRANLDGTQPQPNFIPGASSPLDVEVDDAHIYWTNTGGDSPGTNSIGRANIDGSSPNQSFIGGLSVGGGLAVDPYPEPTSTTLNCAPSPVTLPAGSTCTASVSAAIAPVAGAMVSFASASAGAFAAPGNCTLAATGPTSGSCQLAYTPSAFGPQALTASFGADLRHAASSGTAAITALAPNDFRLGDAKLNKERGTAKLAVTVSGAGEISLAGKRLRPTKVGAKEAGTVKLKLVGSPRTVKKLKHKGKARVSAKITFSPDGGKPNKLPYSLKLRRE